MKKKNESINLKNEMMTPPQKKTSLVLTMNQKIELIIHLHYIAANKKRKRKMKIKLFSSS